MAIAIEVFRIELVDLDTVYDNILPMHIEISLAKTQYEQYPTIRMHLEQDKQKYDFIFFTPYILFNKAVC